MIGFRLQLKHRPDGRLVFTIPVGYKLLLLVIGLLILISLLVTREEGGGSIFIRENTIPLIICLISLLGAAYHECWIFDKAEGRVIHENGLIALHGSKVYGFEDLDRIEVSRFVKGKAGTSRQKSRLPPDHYPFPGDQGWQELTVGELQVLSPHESRNYSPGNRRVQRDFVRESNHGRR